MNPEKEVLKHLRALLERDIRINLHRYPIHLFFQDGDLVMEGEVEDISVKKVALELAGSARGIGRIIDRLRVVPAEPMGDAEIGDHVCRVLLEEPAFENCFIQDAADGRAQTITEAPPEVAGMIVVEVSDGVVMLNGQVPSLAHKRLAGVLAWWVPGTRDVVNGLEEVPTEQECDEDLTDAVRLVLEKDPFVNADKIRVSSKDFVVTLEGFTTHETMRQMAERDTWYVFGVDRVINRIQVQR
ncbi:MAG: BON domain-containing protein [Deltaproteobacteria bacterium]|nr:BON domain-containing protein [Deltaproteobacteria bacterium]